MTVARRKNAAWRNPGRVFYEKRTCYTCIANYRFDMLALRLTSDIEMRLERLAKKTGRTKSYYAREAILEHLEDLEDAYLALRRLKNPARTYSAKEVKRELGL
jgi:RHH-type rel operon transcriptional repressor/antitoxin RelB